MTKTKLAINIDKGLKKEFQMKALSEDKTITEILIKYIKEYVEK